MWVKIARIVSYLMENPQNEQFRRQVNPLTPISGLTMLVVCPGNPMEELVGLGAGLGTQLIFLGNKYASIYYFLIRWVVSTQVNSCTHTHQVTVFKYKYF